MCYINFNDHKLSLFSLCLRWMIFGIAVGCRIQSILAAEDEIVKDIPSPDYLDEIKVSNCQTSCQYYMRFG